MLKQERIIFRIDEATRIKIINACCKYDVTISQLMRYALQNFLENGASNKNKNE